MTVPLPSYARDAEHAARIAAHIQQLCDDAPPLPRRLLHLLRSDHVTTGPAGPEDGDRDRSLR